MAQIKFYSLAAMPSENIDENGLYFIDNGEIYKGAVRFGHGRVTTQETVPSDAVRGDINVYGGVAKVFDGTAWQELGSKTPTFDTGDSDGQLKLGSVNATVSGWGTLAASVSANASSISDLESAVSAIASIVDADNGGAVSASSGTFTNLTVTSTATFSVTNVSAETITINGSTVEQIADKQIAAISSATATSTANGVTVSVTTEGGSVTAVQVDATAFGNVMHFKDTVSNTANVNNPAAGDIVVIAGVTDSESTFKNGQEYIYTNGNTWELIGDQNTYAIKATVDASFSAIASSWASLGGAAFVGTASTVTADATTLPTCSAVAAYVSSVVTGLSSTVSASANGVEFSVTQTSGKLTSASLTGVGTAASKNFADTLTSTGTSLPTESAVAAYVAAAISEALTWQTA